MATGMIIDGVFASQAIDSSGEVLDVEGCDISTLDKDGVLNYEHKEGDKKGTGNNGEEIVGKIIYARKIFKQSDCETDRQIMYWNKIGNIPFVYGMCRLYDGAGHSGAQALAAQIRDHVANNEQVLVRFSIEGSTLERHGNRLSQSVARRVAATLKPCNRTAVSGLIEDPKAPDGFEKKPAKQEKPVKDILASLFDDKRDSEDAKKREHEHPMYSKLGGVAEIECSPLIKDEEEITKAMKLVIKARMLKALSAGSYSGAPGSLTGGAALQREDLHGMKNRALAVLRDHGKKNFVKAEFKAILKTKLPEADDSFIDHFADLAEDYHVKLKKMMKLFKGEEDQQVQEEVKSKKKKKPAAKAQAKTPVKAKVSPAPAQKPAAVKASAPKGQKVPLKSPTLPKGAFKTPAQAAVTEPHWDPATGTLHTPEGSYKANYNPEHWDKILNNPDFVDKFDSVMNNWKIVHNMRRKGITIPGETSIAAMMGGYSSNEQVPIQEIAIQHTLETAPPETFDKRPPTPEEDATLREKFSGKKWPETNQEWFHHHDTDVTTTVADREANPGKPIGEVPTRKIGKPEDKIGTLNYYHRLHPLLHELMKKHGMNGAKIVDELIKAKDNFNEWKATKRSEFDKPLIQWRKRRERELTAQGMSPEQIKPIISEEGKKEREKLGTWGSFEDKLKYAGPIVEHLSNKTLRYMVGMLGYGDSHVPDTHFVRHFFGLRPNNDQDAETSTHLKDVLLDPKNAHLLSQIDEHYRKNHPAAKWAQQRYFDGKEDVHSTFPGFWAHWMNIVPHERAQGLRPGAGRGNTANEFSTHAPYWWAVSQQMRKHGIPGWEDMIFKMVHEMAHLPMQARVANALEEMHQSHGPIGAMISYYMMVPALFNSKGRDHASMIRKMEALTIDLKKATSDFSSMTPPEDENEPDETIYFGGHRVIPGTAKTIDGDFNLLHEDRTHYVAIPVGSKDRLNTMKRFPKAKEGTHYTVLARPRVYASDLE